MMFKECRTTRVTMSQPQGSRPSTAARDVTARVNNRSQTPSIRSPADGRRRPSGGTNGDGGAMVVVNDGLIPPKAYNFTLHDTTQQHESFKTQQRGSLRKFCFLLHDVRNKISPSVSVYNLPSAQNKIKTSQLQDNKQAHLQHENDTDSW